MSMEFEERFHKRKHSLERDDYPTDYFKVSRIFHTIGGVWSPNTNTICFKMLYNIYTIIVIIFVVIYFAIAQFITLKDSWSDLKALIKNMSMVLTHGIGFFKFLIWYPFEYNTRKLYTLAVIGQMICIFLYAYIIIGMDTLFMCTLNHASAHLAILRGALRTLRPRAELRTGSEDKNMLQEEMVHQMKKCINHLQIIMNICNEIENLFSNLTLGQMLTTLFTLCTCLFLVSTTPIASIGFLAELAYTSAAFFQIFIYCRFGNEVYLESSNIPEALYECDWQNSGRKLRSLLLITMARMRRPIFLTVGKFAPLTLSTFVTIVRGSYSFFAVLKQVNDPATAVSKI